MYNCSICGKTVPPGHPPSSGVSSRVACVEHELQRRLAEKCEPLVVIHLPIKDAAIKVVVVGMRLDEEAFAPVHESEIDAAMH